MLAVLKGREYLLETSNTKNDSADLFQIKFCHKNEIGQFVHGVTSEEVLKMMVERYKYLVDKDGSTENIRALLHLQQAYQAITDRNYNRIKKKNRNDQPRNGIPVQTPGSKG